MSILIKCESLFIRNQWAFSWNVSRVYLTRAPARRSCSMRSLETKMKIVCKIIRDKHKILFAKSWETKGDCLQNHERQRWKIVCKIIAVSWQPEHLIATSGSNMQWSVSVVVDDVRVSSGPQDHRQGVLYGQHLSFVDNNCPGDNFLYFFFLSFYNSSCSFVDTLQLPETAVWTEVLPSPSGTSVAAPWDCL